LKGKRRGGGISDHRDSKTLELKNELLHKNNKNTITPHPQWWSSHGSHTGLWRTCDESYCASLHAPSSKIQFCRAALLLSTFASFGALAINALIALEHPRFPPRRNTVALQLEAAVAFVLFLAMCVGASIGRAALGPLSGDFALVVLGWLMAAAAAGINLKLARAEGSDGGEFSPGYVPFGDDEDTGAAAPPGVHAVQPLPPA
jgi:hypothetical protein